MALFDAAMQAFPYVFHPITVLGASVLVLVHYEWLHEAEAAGSVWRRVGVFLGAGVLALLPTATFFLATGSNPVNATQGNSWEMDALVASGLLIVALTTWFAWKREDWGTLVPPAMQALALVTIPYALLSPLWNVSGHVITAFMPTLYLTLVDRKFWPLLLVPLATGPNRLYLDAHTLGQVIGGYVVVLLVVLPVYWHAYDGFGEPVERPVGT